MVKAARAVAIAVASSSFLACAQAQDVSFTRDIVPVLKARCVACHMSGDEQGALALAPKRAYDSLVNVPSVQSDRIRVKPGAPDDSYLILKLQGTHVGAGGQGAQMPLGAAPLSREVLDQIRAWVAQGAARN